ncbi:hypothetical protein [Acinetobacter genomosp. 15BJ]|uniref:Uncharacterized protein n=1 Tax=Acinetobacter genomosp. 15BJ TaxID=106651 RepID=R9B4U2_9GAMM|nr:hypothetical protein [Acinetobacter genomosp. 15BJ]EOR07396.1 hypothetical protein F896_01769 [Acinetobacter genomosp. 15BJ]MCH7291531.1 hypothetical protein [Acinetobacter genomosp. 15BJ]MDO3657050.1 hypothetical protein [Acinetobacter genomosp. 15BJ]
MVNNAVEMLFKLLTDTNIPEGHIALVRIQDDLTYDQVMTNLEQVNALPGFTVIGVTSIPNPDTSDWQLTNCTYENGVLSWTEGQLDLGTETTPDIAYGYHAGITANIDDKLEMIVPNITALATGVLSGARLADVNGVKAGQSNIGFNSGNSEQGLTLLGTSYQTTDLPVKYTMTYVSTTAVEHVITSTDGTIELFRETQNIPAFEETAYFNVIATVKDENEMFTTTVSVSRS